MNIEPENHPDDGAPQVLADEIAPVNEPASAAASTSNRQIEVQMKAMSRRSFLWAAAAVGSGYGGLHWLNSRRLDDGVAWPLRRALSFDESVNRDFFSPARLAPTFANNRIEPIRTNGDAGLGSDFDAAAWRLQVQDLDGETKEYTLQQIKQLPQTDMITELKCIEGWARVNRWTGVRLRDFLEKFPPGSGDGKFDLKNSETWPAYIGLNTPDGGYYVGLETEAALHSQTLLCYAMNGKPLQSENGAPLRLAIPVKYGIKNLKRIGTIFFSNTRPPDYWAERGYDYHAGH